MRDGFIKVLTEVAKNNPEVMFLTGDLGFKIFDNFITQCPKQFLNVGVAEQSMLGVAMGMSLEGRRVLVYSIANFHIFRALEQIRNDVCYHEADVKIVSTGGGFGYGTAGMSHHATEDLSIMRALPHMTVLTPGDAWEAIGATQFMLNNKGPFYLSLEKSNINSQKIDEVFEFGKIRQLRDGADLTLISVGSVLSEVVLAADILAKENIFCRVLSVHCLKPIDQDAIIRAAKETGGIITIEENSIFGGLGSTVSEVCMENNVGSKKFTMMGLRNEFSAIVGDPTYLRHYYKLDSEAIIAKAKKLLK